MKLIATMPLRNEAWIVGLSARVVLRWCDELIVLLHASTDNTREILEQIRLEHPGRVTILEEPDPTWREMEHRQRLLMAARARGATHIAVTDADEVLSGNLLLEVRLHIESLAQGQYLPTGMLCMWRSLDRLRTDGRIWANRRDLVLAFCDKRALKWQSVNNYDHHHRDPIGSKKGPRELTPGGVMHLQWANWRRLIAKHAWYQMHERLRYPGKPVQQIAKLYAMAPDETGLRTEQCPASWWAPYADLLHHVDLNAEPWHEAECRRLLDEHGTQRFTGLNLHGMEATCAVTQF